MLSIISHAKYKFGTWKEFMERISDLRRVVWHPQWTIIIREPGHGTGNRKQMGPSTQTQLMETELGQKGTLGRMVESKAQLPTLSIIL